MKKIIFVLALMLAANAFAFADKDAECPMPQIKSSDEFLKIKELAGAWQGTARHADGKEEAVKVNYEITSGGTAVVETLMPGTDHEMVSIYYDQDGKLRMTHYCMLGNRPVLELKHSTPKTLDLELARHSGIGKKELHMHSLKMTFEKDKLTQLWTGYDKGKPKEESVFTLTRPVPEVPATAKTPT